MESWNKSNPDLDKFLDYDITPETNSNRPPAEDPPTEATAEKASEPIRLSKISMASPKKALPLDRMNRIDLVSYFFSQGKTIPQIVKILETDYGQTDISRETPYHDLAFAASHRWLAYNPPRTLEWTNEIRSKSRGIIETAIPNWGGRMAVINESAKMTSRSIYHIALRLAEEYARDWGFPVNCEPGEPRRYRQHVPGSEKQDPWWREKSPPQPGKKDVHPVELQLEVRLGFSGGDTVGKTAEVLGQELDKKIEDWEKDLKKAFSASLKANGRSFPNPTIKRRFKVKLRLLLVNLVTGFGTTATSHPIAFLASMIAKNKRLGSRAEVKCFNAAPFVRIGEREKFFKEHRNAREVRNFVRQYGLDIIVTSAGSLDDHHSVFPRYYEEWAGGEKMKSPDETRSPEAEKFPVKLLQKYQVKGDVLWQPITSEGPIDLVGQLSEEDKKKLRFSPLSLMTLEDVREHRKAGRDVILVLANCGRCAEPKEQVLEALFSHEESLISHVVADRVSVARALGHPDTPPPPPPTRSDKREGQG